MTTTAREPEPAATLNARGPFPAATETRLPDLPSGWAPCERCGQPAPPLPASPVPVYEYPREPYHLCAVQHDRACRERAAARLAALAGRMDALAAEETAGPAPRPRKAASARSRPSRARATLLGTARERVGTNGQDGAPTGPEVA